MQMVSDKMESGSDRYGIVTHKGAECDCGYTVQQVPVKSKASNSQYNWKVTRIHKSRV
jgi:hypothetical protein